MTDHLSLDARLWSLDRFRALEASHPSLYLGLKSCISAFGRVDIAALERLMAARGAEAVEPARRAGEPALHTATIVGGMLSQLIGRVEKAVADAGGTGDPELAVLLEAARRNRTALLDEAPSRIAEALASSPEYARHRAAAVAAVDAAALHLELLRTRSARADAKYAELAPMVGDLKEVWAGLDRALAPLSRQEQDSIRGPKLEAMGAAAREIAGNLFGRKMRDRAAGDWPAPEIPPGESAAERFAWALASRDFGTAGRLLAPWLAADWPAGRIEEEFTREVEASVAGFDLPAAPPPGAWEVGSNPLDLAGLREDLSEPVPAAINEDNYRGWWPIQILTEEEDGWLTDLAQLVSVYVIVVELGGRELIGYLRFGE
ncbi:MAG TPA: hypothetical protein VJN95_03765 [Gemmatimonadales bacterium]|nr:hypothetical protein [Gemmatimonadales bacterium]